jgi:8-oxo-dGTP pyrophosphatase MutT (NUDIX family)
MRKYVGVLVKHKEEFLLCKRSPKTKSLPGMWSIPAGKLEVYESTHEGAKREFFEETNISIINKKIKILDIIDRYSRDGSRINGQFYVFLLESPDRLVPDLVNAIDGDEHTECGYFIVEELDGMNIDEKLKNLIKSLV